MDSMPTHTLAPAGFNPFDIQKMVNLLYQEGLTSPAAPVQPPTSAQPPNASPLGQPNAMTAMPVSQEVLPMQPSPNPQLSVAPAASSPQTQQRNQPCWLTSATGMASAAQQPPPFAETAYSQEPVLHAQQPPIFMPPMVPILIPDAAPSMMGQPMGWLSAGNAARPPENPSNPTANAPAQTGQMPQMEQMNPNVPTQTVQMSPNAPSQTGQMNPNAPVEPFLTGLPTAFVPSWMDSYVNRMGQPLHSPPAPVSATPAASHDATPFDVQQIRADFPILHRLVHGKPLIWFDNAATTQKPNAVIESLSHFYRTHYSNIHRGAHTLAAEATEAYESARKKIAKFIGASSENECIFVRGTTEGINLVAQTYGKKILQAGDEILITLLEHHANIVPWQMLAKEKGAKLVAAPVNDHGEVMLDDYFRLLSPRTKIVAIAQVSNALGTVLPIREMVQMAHRFGAVVLVDGAQGIPHQRTNVQEMDADFYVFSGHKLFGPSGIGVVYGKKALLETMPPWHGGGNMIENVTLEHTTYNQPPAKFEAGTPNITDAVGLGAAIDYLNSIGMEKIAEYEHALTEYAMAGLRRIPKIRLIGTSPTKVSVLSFVVEGMTTEQVGKILDSEGIAVRSGHHCAQPVLRRFGVEATVRPSLAFYNTRTEIDKMLAILSRL
jgi:cysteine desulfurase / selenocysteine lyase